MKAKGNKPICAGASFQIIALFFAVLQEGFNNGAERRSISAIVRRRLSRYNNKRERRKN
jgi:hypothetical protein